MVPVATLLVVLNVPALPLSMVCSVSWMRMSVSSGHVMEESVLIQLETIHVNVKVEQQVEIVNR